MTYLLGISCLLVMIETILNCMRYLSPQAGILVGAVYFTYSQGVWGDQQDVTECLRRWAEYIRSINTRRPPTFDQCGKVIVRKILLKFQPYHYIMRFNTKYITR